MSSTPTPGQDIIDSRDVIQAIEDAYGEYVDGCNGADEDALDEDDWKSHVTDIGEESDLVDLIALNEQGEDNLHDWRYGVTLIHEYYFQTYAEDFADEIGAIDRNATWPLNHIDWEAAADELKMDYYEVSFGNYSYWGR